MRISEQKILSLKILLRRQTGNEYDTERAQTTGRAILRLVGIKLYGVYKKDFINEK